jgi:putative endonuclease
MTSNNYYVYILSNIKNNVVYVGVTNDLKRRVYEHKNKLVAGFTAKYNVNKLIYFEQFSNINDAIHRGKNIKKWKRQWKNELIGKTNPLWNDTAIYCMIRK